MKLNRSIALKKVAKNLFQQCDVEVLELRVSFFNAKCIVYSVRATILYATFYTFYLQLFKVF